MDLGPVRGHSAAEQETGRERHDQYECRKEQQRIAERARGVLVRPAAPAVPPAATSLHATAWTPRAS